MRIKTNLKIIWAFSFAFLACQQNERQSNIQNAQPLPKTSATAAPTAVAFDNVNSVNAVNAAANNLKPNAKLTPAISATPKATVSPTAAPSNSAIAKKYKNYNGKGIIKKIDVAGGSIVIDHEDIGDYMVAMEMPFPVVNKKILDGLKVGDKVSFVLETGVGVERIISIRKN